MTESTLLGASLTEQSIRDAVRDWYIALDQHVPLEQVLPYLVQDGLEMRFPEATLTTLDEFKGWYEAVTNRFFDEVHELKSVEVEPTARGEALVKVVVNWQAHIWNPPAARSQWLGFDAYQTWIVVAGEDGSPLVKTYIVDDLDPMEGSASL
ncbi:MULTISPECIES: nuclear transport factor 2 family protein [Streptomyces]|uniref:Nuclear transport factor 2 family protein n=1 Tax=Streptomyces lutosisoli TaxID=2665721 RepID=A0ABW2VYH8_9ACTN|nr:nuclear transport factor 2 family protein [Streptomyces sp. NBC_01236]